MSQRFFISESIEAGQLELTGAEARHLGRVMRAQPGDTVIVFNGRGLESRAQVCRVEKNVVLLQLESPCSVDRERPDPLVLGVALPRGDRQKWLVEKLVELGAASLVPLVTERGVAQPIEKALDRLRRMVIEASKQCGRNQLMEIETPASLDDFCQAHADFPGRLIAHPDETVATLDRSSLKAGSSQATAVAVGPEGGFSEAELQVASQYGWQQVSLGPRVLRVETAAVLLAALTG